MNIIKESYTHTKTCTYSTIRVVSTNEVLFMEWWRELLACECLVRWFLKLSSALGRSCGACIRCWRPRFLRITLPCNYLGIIREQPTLSLHNHNPQPLCLLLDLPSLLLFGLHLCLFCLTLFFSLISPLCLFVSSSIRPGRSHVFGGVFHSKVGTCRVQRKLCTVTPFSLMLSGLIVSASLWTMLLFTLLD